MYHIFRPMLFRLDAELAHQLSVGVARLGQTVLPFTLESMFAFAHPMLRSEVLGLSFENPIGLAAGFDKNAKLVRFCEKLGFGFAEVGSVSARKSKGNRRPRAFRLPEDKALINRMGLNNDGADRIARRIRLGRRKYSIPIGVNLAKTHDPAIMGQAAIDDFRQSFNLLAPVADYVALNISCPNTAEGKTFEDPNVLDDLLTAIMSQRTELGLSIPILIKFSPPINKEVVLDSLVDELLLVAGSHSVSGFIASNTASDRSGLSSDTDLILGIGSGGVSGQPLTDRSTALIRYIYRKTGGSCPIIGVGGVASAEQAYEKIRAGASLIQVYTGLVYEGPGLVRDIKKGLVELLQRDGYASIQNAVGSRQD